MIRIGKATVQEVTTATETVTGGAFRLGYMRSDTDGTVYVDGVRQKVWRGKNAARLCAAYFYGAADAYNAGTIGDYDSPYMRGEIRATVMRTSGAQKQYDEGASDANYRRYAR